MCLVFLAVSGTAARASRGSFGIGADPGRHEHRRPSTKKRPAGKKMAFRRGKLATVIDQIEHGHHVFRAYFKSAFLKAV
jgi:hypothetical protein